MPEYSVKPSEPTIKCLPPVNYNKPWVSNELLMRNKDQASDSVNKINELVEFINKMAGTVQKLEEALSTLRDKINERGASG